MSLRTLGLARAGLRLQPAARIRPSPAMNSQPAQGQGQILKSMRARNYTSRALPQSSIGSRPGPSSSKPVTKPPSNTGSWSDNWPSAMVPIFLLSTAIFMSLSLLRTHLSHNRSLAESDERIVALEAQLARLRSEAKRRQERAQRERDRILPLVVQSVLQRVGAMRPEEEDKEVIEERLVV